MGWRRSLALFALAAAAACGAEVGPNGNVNPALGETRMTRCAQASDAAVSDDEMVGLLSDFARRNAMKFKDERPNGAYLSYLQIDDPYVIVEHKYLSQRDSLEHMIVTFRSVEDDDRGRGIEAALYDNLGQHMMLESCGGYVAAITPGWRLRE